MTLLTILAAHALTVGAAAATPVATATASAKSPAAMTLAANDAPRCEAKRPEFGDSLDVECTLLESATPRKFRFEIRFTGGHDDTKISLSATLNGKPLTCDEGSKTKLFAEDGEVGLDCYFSSERIKGAQELKVAIECYHAQYSEHTLHVL